MRRSVRGTFAPIEREGDDMTWLVMSGRHVLRACEVADFAEDGCPKSRFLCKNLDARRCADGWPLNFNDVLRKSNGAMGGISSSVAFLPDLGRL